jgi:hypothetical protein
MLDLCTSLESKALDLCTSLEMLDVMSRQGRSPDLGYVDFRMTKH